MAQTFIDEKTRSAEEVESLQVAEESREAQWDHPSVMADLFMGTFRSKAFVPFPEQSDEDKRIGDAYVEKVHAYLEKNYNADEVDQTGEIPDSVMKDLAAMGVFAMKIPQKYGGQGLSQLNYLRALSAIMAHCGSLGALVSAHQSIGVPQPLLLFGTEEQKQKYLPRFAEGWISAFALTEPEVGSDPARLSTTATPVDNGENYLINGTKLWCTNSVIADVLVVMAQTPSITVKGREKKQITAFIVETKDPGFEVLHRCRFMGLNGIQNGLIRFKDVKVPKENIIWGLGKGLKLALTTLNAGRLSIPAGVAGGSREALRIARIWGNERKQWGAEVGKHEPGAQKIASISANILAMDAMTYATGIWVDRKEQDIRLEAAMAKYFTTVRSHILCEEVLQLRAGRGYERASSLKARGEIPTPIERWVRDSRINQIVEGTNEIMKLFISREALDKHLEVAGDVLNPRLPITRRLSALVRATFFYAYWYPKQWLNFCYWPFFASHGRLGKQLRYISRTSSRLARTLFHLMVLNGPKLEFRQLQLGRIVDIAVELFAMSATVGRALRGKKSEAHIEASAELFCLEARARIEDNFRGLRSNHDAAYRSLAKRVLKDEMLWQELPGYFDEAPAGTQRHEPQEPKVKTVRTGGGSAEAQAASVAAQPHGK
jgi:alkylation response protein AidB-like acyl-CoA dehydrogenase